jgi:hypothetical protein
MKLRIARALFALLLLAGVGAPLASQITIKCWKEGCVTDPDTGKTMCVREEIPCPSQT